MSSVSTKLILSNNYIKLFIHEGEALNGECSPFVYCNQPKFSNLRAVFRQKLIFVGQEGVIPKGFPMGLDCILSKFRLAKPSLLTDVRAVVEGEP